MAYCLHYAIITKPSNLHLIGRLQFPWLTSSILSATGKRTHSLYTISLTIQVTFGTTFKISSDFHTPQKALSDYAANLLQPASDGCCADIGKFFFKIGPTPASFCLFSFFSTTILQKNCRLQRESNSDRRSRRRAR